MHLSKLKILGLIFGAFLFVITPFAFIHAQVTVDIQAQIQELLGRIATLQQQLSQQQTGQQPVRSSSADTRSAAASVTGAPYVEGEVLVTFKSPGGGDAMLDESTLSRKTQAVEDSFRVNAVGEMIAGKTVLFKTENNESTKNLVNRMSRDASIELVQPNYIYTLQEQEVPWGIGAAQGINATKAWQNRGLPNFSRGVNGEGVVVAVIDTGVDYNHEDLAQNIWSNSGEDCSNGRDDDGNGFIDDCRGWNFGNGDNDISDIYYQGGVLLPHGTHVSGTIAALDNSIGVVGVAPKAKIMPIKIFSRPGNATTFEFVRSIDYAWRNGAKVINMSFGYRWDERWGAHNDPLGQAAVNRAYNAGVTLVAAAGNNGIQTQFYPAAYDHVISVGAVDRQHERASFSNMGDWLDVVAPGVDIKSTVLDNSYASWNGTSMASPHVAGAVALLLQRYPSATPAQVEEALHRYAVGSEGGRTGSDFYGYGFVDASALVSGAIPSAPQPPAVGSGTIKIRATLDGNPVTIAAPIVFDYTSPAGVFTKNVSSDVQHDYQNMPTGVHQVAYMGVNIPAGVRLQTITSNPKQTLRRGGEITFTFNFITLPDSGGLGDRARDARTVFGVTSTSRADNAATTNLFRRFDGSLTDGAGGTIYEPTHGGNLISTYDDMRQPWLACEVLGYSPVGNTYAREHAGWILEIPTMTVVDVDANGNNIYRERIAYRHNGVWNTTTGTFNGGKGVQFGTYTTRNGTYDAWEGLQTIKKLVCYEAQTTSTPPAATIGTIKIKATLNGSAWSGPLRVSYRAPAGAGTSNDDFPVNVPFVAQVPIGNYTLNHVGGGPSGVVLDNLNGEHAAVTKELTAGGTITYTFNFGTGSNSNTGAAATTGTVHIRATLNGDAATASGQAVIDYLAPAGNAVDHELTVPSDFPNVPIGTYTVKYKSATLPSGVSFKGINGTYRDTVGQTLTSGGDITFTLDFIGSSGSAASSGTSPSYTHYTTGAWSECSGYNPVTGVGGVQTRSVTPYTNTTAPNEPAPASSQSCSVTIATGTVRIIATYNGAPVSMPLQFVIDYNAPAGNAVGHALTVPSDFLNVPVGTYTVKYRSVTLPPGALSGITFKGINGTFLDTVGQTLTAGGTITFTLDFRGPTSMKDSSYKMANALEAVRAAFKGVLSEIFQKR